MTDEHDKPTPDADCDLEREIRQARKFTSQEAMARMAGPGAMKGASPVSPVQQADTEIGTWLRANVPDATGALQVVLQRHLKGTPALLDNLERPLVALARYCERILGSEELLAELVREADVEWGRMMDERPHFERSGSAPEPGDPYTIRSVRQTLNQVLAELAAA